MTPVALCADDYALSPGIDEGILALAEAKRISAFSCMTASARWPEAAAALKPFFDKIDIGLHFTLTQLRPLGPMARLAPDGAFPPMGWLYAQAALRAFDKDEIAQELDRQLSAFKAATGREPDFLDGHHHEHQLPVVRDAVAQVWTKRPGWIRNTATPLARVFSRGIAKPRAAVLAAYGRAARRAWITAGIKSNADFAGVRNFTEREPYGVLMRAYLKGARPGLLIMCHPGRLDDELGRIDHVTESRADELAYLSGTEFPADLAAAGCELARLSEIAR
jgi:predicted glycoside hydrolase/deacetylase ChbG (UPF0249 family)